MADEHTNFLVDLIYGQMTKATDDFTLIAKETIDAFINSRRKLTQDALRELIDMHPTGLTMDQSLYVQELNERSKVMIDILNALKSSILKRVEEYKELLKLQTEEMKENEEEYNAEKVAERWIKMMDENISIDEDIESITRQISRKNFDKGDKNEE
jgi:hypothetical protein